MLPAELMGLNTKNFKQLNSIIKNKNFLNSLIVNVAATLNFIRNKKYNSIIINYDESSESLFKWYQQLIAESLGKKGKGLMPVISPAPKDHHSALQLYLDGPKDKFFHIFSLEENAKKKLR
jgi:glucose-6-phosphate isomerase